MNDEMSDDEKIRLILAAAFVFARIVGQDRTDPNRVKSSLRDADELIFQTRRPV